MLHAAEKKERSFASVICRRIANSGAQDDDLTPQIGGIGGVEGCQAGRWQNLLPRTRATSKAVLHAAEKERGVLRERDLQTYCEQRRSG
jgi:hypothetical protein